MSDQHTAGPWQAKKNRSSAAVYDGYGTALARLPSSEYFLSRRMADATLMAAAPTMLQVLRQVDVGITGSEANATTREQWEADMVAVKASVRQALQLAVGAA